MDLAADEFDHAAEVFGIFFKVHIIGIDDEEWAFLVFIDPVIVFLVESLEVIETHAALVTASAVVYVLDQCWNAGLQVNQQVWR